MECVEVTDDERHTAIAKYVHGVVYTEAKQYRFSALHGHFGGSMDGQAWGFQPYWTDTNGIPFGAFHLAFGSRILVEFKTHNLKSFTALKELKVKKAKPQHYVQMSLYMASHDLPLALYCAVCKDNDELYFEFVEPNPELAHEALQKANAILTSQRPPARISESPSWFACRFCDHRLVCHYGQEPVKNCRTCRFSYPAENAEWRCSRWNHATIPFDAQQIGCDAYAKILD